MKNALILLIAVLLMPRYGFGQAPTATPLWQTLPVEPPMPPPDQSGLAAVNNIKLYYAVFNKKGKDPVILLHGGFASSDVWSFEVPVLCKTHQVIVVDNRGHGRSTMSGQPFSYNIMSADVLQLMDILHIKKASIVGWSDGGIMGLLLAIHHPERINKLFTFGANYNSSGYKPEPSDTSKATLFMSRAAANYRRLSPTPNNFLVLRKALGKLYSNEPNLAAAELKLIKAPTVIAFGEYEQFIKREHFQEMAKLIPNARLVMIPNVSHGGPIQDPASFHKAVMRLLEGDSDMEKMLDYSRPGAAHELLGQLSGSWNFQDAKLAFVKGTLVRKAIFNGRFYNVEITGGKLQVPIAGGQMKEENYQCLQTEGFDNVRNKYFTTSINNHIGSDTQFQSGSYDPAKKQWIYEWESEILPGKKIVSRRIITITDSGHYTEEYFELQEGKVVKVRELDYTRN